MNKMHNEYYISLTSIPSRFKFLNNILDSLVNQNIKPKKIFLHIPYKYRRNFGDFDLPDVSAYPDVVINRCEDYGSNTKFLPMLHMTEIEDTVPIIVVDDDIFYDSIVSTTLLDLSAKYPNCATCMFGVTNATFFINNFWDYNLQKTKNTQNIYPVGLRGKKEGYIDVFEGFAGTCLQKRFFDNSVFDIPIDDIYFCDDIWMSGHVIKNGFRIVVTSTNTKNTIFVHNIDALSCENKRFERNFYTLRLLQDRYKIFI